jgi:hypothetical protein
MTDDVWTRSTRQIIPAILDAVATVYTIDPEPAEPEASRRSGLHELEEKVQAP